MKTRTRLTRQAWVQAALEALAEGGLAAVAIVPLAKRLGATKGSFYWHFTNREALVEAALADWEHSHTAAVIAEIEASSDDPLLQLRLLFKRVTELAARDRIELALLATADHPTVQPVLERVTCRRIDFAAELFQRLGMSRGEARRRALLAYSAYLGYAQLVHATPQLLPGTQAARRAYLNDVLAALTVRVPDELLEAVRKAAELPLARDERSQRIADLVRTATGRRWVGVYEVTATEVVSLAWSGPAPPAHPRFPVERGLTGAAIRACSPIVSNNVASDPRYLTALASTGSELIVPVVVGDRVVGTLDVEDERNDAFSDDDRRLFERIGREMGHLYE